MLRVLIIRGAEVEPVGEDFGGVGQIDVAVLVEVGAGAPVGRGAGV